MADDEKLRALTVQIEANTRGLEKAMQRVEKQISGSLTKVVASTKKDVAGLESVLANTDRRLSGFGRSLIPSLGAIGAALSVREVAKYADAWTSAKNALAVAGISGQNQVKVLDQLYQAAQRNAAPVTALADLFGKAAQASDNLGANQESLIKFSSGVATALRVAGTSAGAASGALTQLGQLLGSARVQAEEFNSVNEGARPILMAVAAGLDEAGGSVSRLKQIVNDGNLTGRQFFEAFLKGLPEIEKMAGSATTTIDQGMTKVNNALTKYIGQTDEGLGASQRLVKGLSALADNFDTTADLALNLASVLAGALVGRSIVGMIAKLALGTQALIAFGRSLAAIRTAGLAATFTGIGSAAGPIGALIGTAVVGALIAFTGSSEKASAGARTYADALKKVEDAAKGAKEGVEGATAAIDEREKNQLSEGVDVGVQKIEEARAAALKLFQDIIDAVPRRLISEEQLSSLQDLHDGLENGTTSANDVKQSLYALANSNPKFQTLADQLEPLLDALDKAIQATDMLKSRLGTGGPSFRQSENDSMSAYEAMKAGADKFIAEAMRRNSLTEEQLRLEKEIANVRNDALKDGITLTDKQVENIAKANLQAEKTRENARKIARILGLDQELAADIGRPLSRHSEASFLACIGA